MPGDSKERIRGCNFHDGFSLCLEWKKKYKINQMFNLLQSENFGNLQLNINGYQ